ncbi:MAG: hypothetical protein KGY67_05665 [Candidatus Thermoplasmatota archaeon]|nr:hypothetical protein [Candidatus Thermoplasmatota archaeon]
MNRKIIGMLIVGLLLFSGASNFLNAETTNEQEQNFVTIGKNISFSTPEILNSETGTKIRFDETDRYKTSIGKPMMPVKTTVYTFPFGSKIHDVTALISDVSTMPLTNQIEASPIPLPYDTTYVKESELIQSSLKNEGELEIFSGFYPKSWYEYNVKIGLNENNERTTFVIVNTYPVRYSMEEETIEYASDIHIDISYSEPQNDIATNSEYEFLIIAGSAYVDELQPFVEFKQDNGIDTKLVITDEIDTDGFDEAEQIKYFIKQELDESNIKSVLLVGGHRSFWGFNKPELQIPTRFIYLDDTGEPGFVSDLYYADIYEYDNETGTSIFSSWDTDGDGKYGEWYYTPDEISGKEDNVDLLPDVHLGRWACRTEEEVKNMVQKVMNYEQKDNTEEEWFNRMISLSGDDFQDQIMLNISWDTTGLQGSFTIHAESANTIGQTGPEDTVTVEVDHTRESVVTFSEDDHLTTDLNYPNLPIAEITVPSDGNVLGNSNVYNENPPNAYIGYRWTPVNYTDNVVYIRGKSYNPQPHTETGVDTILKIWITDENENIVFGPVLTNQSMYFEGEWATQKAMDFMPTNMEKIKLWTSMGTFQGSEDDVHDGIDLVVDQLSEGAGFWYIAGHANPMIYANHYPGIPGGRANGDVKGLTQFSPFSGLNPKDIFPLTELDNDGKLPVLVLSGCHPCQIDVSFLRLFTEGKMALWHGTFVWESLGWWLTKLDNRGAIATLGPTGLGYGYIGEGGTQGLGGWLWPEFFRQYNQEGKEVIGEAWTQTLNNYIFEFGPNLDLIDTKTVEEMVLLGDPTLTIG